MDEQKKQKTQKILNLVVNIVVGVILVMALLVTINNISSKQKGYTSLFGTAFMVVQSESMDPDGKYFKENPIDYKERGIQAGFAKGDLLSVKILSDDDKKNLEVGDIISFFQYDENNVRFINSHRIVEKAVADNGEVTYWTHGDNNPAGMREVISTGRLETEPFYLIGKVKGNAGAIGHVLNFFNSQTGFLVCIVIPSFLIVAYFAFNLVREILKYKKAGAVEQKAKYEEELIAKLRAQGVQIPNEVAPEGAPATEVAPPEEKPATTDTPTEENK